MWKGTRFIGHLEAEERFLMSRIEYEREKLYEKRFDSNIRPSVHS
jgi:hypothetical protein